MQRLIDALPILAACMIAGCSMGERQAMIATASDYSVVDPLISSGDRLIVSIFGEEQLSGEYAVNRAGHIDLPLAGPVVASGRTVAEIRDAVVAAYSDGLLINPQVGVEVKDYRPFTILGEVNKAGNYPYVYGLSVIGAVAAAQGYTYRANRSIAVIRRSGEPIFKRYRLDRDLRILPGDVIEIPERSAF